jgi:ABC-type phosphate transport system substrate-binding protein
MIMLKPKHLLLSSLLVLSLTEVHASEMVVIAHPSVGKLDITTIQRIFSGKIIELNGMPIKPFNLSAGVIRSRFLQRFLKQDDDKYVAYWIVRNFIGKGAPPQELSSAAQMIQFVKTTPGAIGYIDESEVNAGINVILR